MYKSKLFLTSIALAGLFGISGTAHATHLYTSNISAMNINMLSEQMMSYTHQGENISDFIPVKYGIMTRLDEYGDNGIRTEKTLLESNEPLEKNVWANLKHLNTDTQYNDDNSRHSRMYMAAVGFNTKDIELAHGGISFGTFLGHISENISSITPNGFSFGVFSRYKYNIFDITGLINNGSINKNSYQTELNQSWINAALDASMNIRLSDILLIKPRVYVGYTKVSTDKDLKIYNDTISAKDFEFVNFVPSAEIYTRLDKDFYASISAKYVSIDGNTDKNVYANSTFIGKTSPQNYAELGLNLEYDINPVILTGGIRKQFEGFDGWVGDISIKYTF